MSYISRAAALALAAALAACAVCAPAALAAPAEAAAPAAAWAAPVARIALDASEPGADGLFTVTLTLYDATYKGMLGYLGYDPAAVSPVDFETKEPTSDFSRFATVPASAKDLDTGEDIPGWLSVKGSSIDAAAGEIAVINLLSLDVPVPNSLITANNQILAGEGGLPIHEFHFRKIGDGGAGLRPVPKPGLPGGFMLVNSGGALSFDLAASFPGSVGESYSVRVSPEPRAITSDDLADMTEAAKAQLRTNFVIFLQIGNYASVSNGYFKWIDDYDKEVVPYIKDGRAMVPLRYLAEQLGASVSYFEETRGVSIRTDRTELLLAVGEREYTDDGLKRAMDVPAEVRNGRTFVPVRFLSEALGRSVHWSEGDKAVIVAPNGYPWTEGNEVEEALYRNAMFLMSPMVRDLGHKMPKRQKIVSDRP